MNMQMFQTRFKAQNSSGINFQNYLEDKTKQDEESCQLPCSSITLFIVLGFFFIIIGITALVSHYQQTIVQIELKQKGLLLFTEPLYLSFSSDSTVEVYLQIQQLTQYDYLINEGKDQKGFFMPNSQICGKYTSNQNINKKVNIYGQALNPTDLAIPCGFFPAMFPQGQITIILNNSSNQLNQTDLIYFSYELQSDDNHENKQWVDTASDPFFQSWISQNAAIKTTKLMGRLSGDFPGYFSLQIQLNNLLPTNYSKATILLSKDQVFGTNNIPFFVISFAQSGLLFLFSFIVYFYNKLLSADVKKNELEAHQIEIKSQSETISVKVADI